MDREQRLKRVKDTEEARRETYASIGSMQELQEYVSNDVKRRVTMPRRKSGDYNDRDIWRGTTTLPKTTALSPNDFDEQLLERADALYKIENPQVITELASKQEKISKTKTLACLRLDAYIALQKEMEQLRTELTEYCGPYWESALRARQNGDADPCKYSKGLVGESLKAAERFETDVSMQSFLAMVAKANKGRSKPKFNSYMNM